MPQIPYPSNVTILKRAAGTNPAANTEISDTVPAGKWWRLMGVSISCVQGITQTPQPTLIIDDGTNVMYQSLGCSAAQAASTTQQYIWASGLPLSAILGAGANLYSTAPLPNDWVLPAGWRVRTSTAGIGANTDYAAPSYFVVEIG